MAMGLIKLVLASLVAQGVVTPAGMATTIADFDFEQCWKDGGVKGSHTFCPISCPTWTVSSLWVPSR